jgi:hypothetical protein
LHPSTNEHHHLGDDLLLHDATLQQYRQVCEACKECTDGWVRSGSIRTVYMQKSNRFQAWSSSL